MKKDQKLGPIFGFLMSRRGITNRTFRTEIMVALVDVYKTAKPEYANHAFNLIENFSYGYGDVYMSYLTENKYEYIDMNGSVITNVSK